MILGMNFKEMPRLEWWLMWLWLMSATVIMAGLAWKGFEFFVVFMWLYIATKDSVDAWVKDARIKFDLTMPLTKTVVPINIPLPLNEFFARFTLSMTLVLLTVVALPIALISTWNYGQQVTYNVIENSPFLMTGLDGLISLGHERLPKYIPQVDLTTEAGMQQFLAQVGGQIVGESIKGGKELAVAFSSKAALVVVKMLVFWVEAIILAIVLNLFYAHGQKMIDIHRKILTMGMEDETVRDNWLDLGERIQTMMERFFSGWFKIMIILVVLLFISLSLVPLKLTLSQVVFLAFWLGFLTSIFKIGGLIATIIAIVLMMFDFQVGFGWWWMPSTMTIDPEIVWTTGNAWSDWGLKIGLMFLAVKSKGLLESYHLTVNIIADQLGIPKVFIIIAVIPFAMGAKLLGMAVGLNLLFLVFSLYQMALVRTEKEKA